MNVYEFGHEHSETLLFFQGSCTCWRDYMPSIRLLARRLHVIVPVIEGHDPMAEGDFISVEKTVRDVSDYLLERGYRELTGVYGLSFGGSMALRMLAEQRITIHKVILDGAITPYELPRWVTRLILLRDYCMVQIIRSSMSTFKLLATPERWTPKDGDGEAKYRGMYSFLRGLSHKTIWNVFDSANNYKMPRSMPPTATKIQFWYGSLEKKSRKKDFRWVSKHLHEVHAREFPEMEHGELVMMHPEKFSDEVTRFLLSETPL